MFVYRLRCIYLYTYFEICHERMDILAISCE